MHESQRASLAGRLILVKRNPVGSQLLSLHHGHFHGKQLGDIVFLSFFFFNLNFSSKTRNTLSLFNLERERETFNVSILK